MTEKKECATSLDQQENKPQSEPATASTGDAAPTVVVKREKIDIEIEAKLKALNAKIKSESATPPTGHATDSDDTGNSNDSSQDDKKLVVPVKSSNEILAELFGVFNAAPPEVLLDDKNLLKKHKKSKKEKKKTRSKPDKSDGECSDSDADPGEGKHKHKSKRKKHKHKHKDSKDKHKDKDREKSKEKSTVQLVKTEEKTETRKRHTPGDSDISTVPAKKQLLQHDQSTDREKNRDRERERERERDKERERERDKERERERDKDRERDRDRDRERERDRERGHNSFYNGYHDSGRVYSKDDNGKTFKIKSERRQSDDLSLSDEETYLREKANGRRRFYGGDTGTRSKQESSDNKRHNTTTRYRGRSNSRQRTRSRSRSRSRSRDLGIDKKRLLEIARRNAISMFKRGNMAGVSEMTPEVKDKVLLKMRYGGRTVQDLTDFCKKISNGEMLSDLSSDEDSDVDKNGNAKAFHHPFQLKEREPIVMHIRNSTPIVPSVRRDDQTKAITMQFPVSSGQVHRMSEVWVPVEKAKEPLVPLPTLPPAKQATNMFKDVQRNVFAKSIPQEEQQEPAFKPATTSLDEPDPAESNGCPQSSSTSIPLSVSTPVPVPMPVPAPSLPVSAPPTTSSVSQPPEKSKPMPFVPEVPIPSAAPQPSASIFPQVMPPSMDVSSIITQRLSAIRRLQDNPADSEALKMMYNAQRDMTSWASSKHLPGQFTGSTGAQVMKVHELNSGPQLWARRDQLTSTKPVTGGMGMTLLQKMGWKPGEGLGRTKTGSLQPLQLTVKLDKRGLVSREDIKQPPPSNRQTNNNMRGTKNTSAVNIAQAALTAHDKHPVCVLNELTSKNKWTPPQYMLKEDTGPSHSRMFLFSVEVNGQAYTPTQACNNKKEAKLNAAKLCLRALGILPPR